VAIPNKATFEKVIKVLQKSMRIQDWNIGIELITSKELVNKYPNEADEDTQAISNRNLRRNYALISINTEYFCDEDENWYDTLVHEMLHIQETNYITTSQAYMSKNGTYFETIHEQYIDTLQKMFSNICPLEKFIKDNPKIFEKEDE